MKDITVKLYLTNMMEITSYWFHVQKRSNFKQLFCTTCRFPHSYSTYVQFAELFLVPLNKTLKYLNYFLLGF